MSASLWDQSLASASGLLTNEECAKLLDCDIFNDDDLLKSLQAAPKLEASHFALQDDHSNTLYPPSPPETKPSPAELANDILQQLDNQCKQENIFSNWLEEKVDLPMFENISQVPERVDIPPQTLGVPAPAYVAPQPTEELLREFETVYDAVELTHLTPPQSPPGPATQLLLSYAQQAQCPPLAPALSIPQQPHHAWPVAAPVVPLAEYDCDLQVVEELVRHRAAQLPSPVPFVDSLSASPRSSPPSSPRSSSTDEDWPAPSSRSKPYSRPSDDRRSRKKEQNKNAATRYRQKKKAEIEVLLNEENTLRQRHTELGEKCSDLQREIRYIKGLMRDVFKAKGLIK
ncbi:activating transcription factor of chaperone [Amyelois transitella]|uniref:activating transcription factor of chaperone n=1 Tax=Amyelois transitella TaxID=680683 RepID=UPI00067D4A46|nr:activating transcription factor of chaperone [Amyelois transitella]